MRRWISLFSLIFTGGLCLFSSLASAGSEPAQSAAADKQSSPLAKIPIERRTLDNGLRVVLSPDHSVPTIALVIYYDVGSRNEEKGRTGFAHLFEHMMFQGSANVSKAEHIQIIEHRGGKMNGTTSTDRTNYFETLPSNELALGLWLEADRMRSLAITQENFENQRQTVMEERRQSIDNQPYGPSMLRINELAYGSYFPYAHSTIGDMADLQNAPLRAVQEFFDTYYAPNNAVLSLTGDFEVEQAMSLIKKYFGDIPKRESKKFNDPPLEPQTSERYEKIYDANAELPAFHIAYHIPPSRTKDHYALELLAMALGDGESSRMYQSLVKNKEILQEISIDTDDRRGPDLFSVWGVVARGKKGSDARAIFYRELEQIAKKGISARELEKVKNRIRSQMIFSLESNLHLAMDLGTFELYSGDARLIRNELSHYEAVTMSDIEKVAKKYFEASNRTVLDIEPGAAKEGKP